MSARPLYPAALERIRAVLYARPQAAPILTAQDIQALLGGWPTVRTIERYAERIRAEWAATCR